MRTKLNLRMISAAGLAIILATTGCQKGQSELKAAEELPSTAAAATTATPERTAEVVFFPSFILDYNYQTPVDDTSLVFEALAHTPVTAPDGHQLTLAEFNAVSGRASMKCVNQGTHVVLNMYGLIPNGVYSIFTTTFHAPGFTETLENLEADGAFGTADGSQGTFVANANGNATISATLPAGSLSEVGSIGSCLAGEYQVIFSAIYHIDGIGHGPVPGPFGTWAFQFGFVYTN